jgi:hypothetical protein
VTRPQILAQLKPDRDRDGLASSTSRDEGSRKVLERFADGRHL